MSKSYSKQWNHADSIIRLRGETYQAETNHNGRRHRKSFNTLSEAKTHCEHKRIQVKNQGNRAFALAEKQVEDALEAIDILSGKVAAEHLQKKKGTPLAEAARFWMQHNRPKGGTVGLSDLHEMYLDSKRIANRRPETVRELENKLGRVVEAFAGRLVHTITNAELESWLDENTGTPGTRNKYKRLINGFFRFARKKKLIEINPAEDIETATEDEVLTEIYTVPEVERMLDAAVELVGSDSVPAATIPTLCIGLFAGLRPSEIAGLQWENIEFEDATILVTPETAKKRRRRHVEMNVNLVAWLLRYHEDSGPVASADITFRRARAKIVEKARLQKWIPDGLRHCYGSYHLAHHQDASKTAFEMGHTDADLLYKHYRELVKKKDAARYWQIRPSKDSRTIKYPKAG